MSESIRREIRTTDRHDRRTIERWFAGGLLNSGEGRASLLQRALADERHHHIGSICNQGINAPPEELFRINLRIDCPDLDAKPGAVGVVNKTRRYDTRRAGKFGNLVASIRRVHYGPAAPGSIQRPPDLLARRTRRERRFEPTDFAKRFAAEGADAHAIDGVGRANVLNHGAGKRLA